ncbi:hypothetical protein [Inhella sp.]|uniref:hypothetical protein n=1 Tax=Inhella sp. TaxID=1921806 RepID=UPI0035B27873
MSAPIEISLSEDQALVLFEFLARFQETNVLRLQNNAEFLALSAISAQLDKSLAQPLSPNYALLLTEARQRLAGGFEGLAPGVQP